ncbi:NAD(P)H-dependent oxidoreductase [Mesoterricola silvestris]|uniref:NAD(P)H-dependent oxidoreductase n=1 Tax=Mesoterricola silvestris TaxID=2927979 RepID=A0AA48GRC7_9BACT|nr:NAD(P)H-dependent oxidoreductase [Mesoterricola silvestris]BDU74290.1 NAD(P)H-dependent oxidoreductase [Mesoterricola silvestris]
MTTATVLSPEDLLKVQEWRYATKQFDPSRKIPAAVWSALEKSLVLSPSSFGLQPWKFLVIQDPALRARLKAVSWGQGQVEDASHLVVFLAKETLTEADVDHFLERVAEVRHQTPESLAAYRSMMVGNLVSGPRAATIDAWAARQAYIALGNFMTSAALLGVDTCPMEGLDAAQYDEILGLAGTGYRTIVACPAGYRAAGDKYAELPKVRFPEAEVINHR